MGGILDYFPYGLVPRAEQGDLLLDIEKAWATHDVIACNASTALGKTFVAATIANWVTRRFPRSKVRVCAPTQILRDQFAGDCPDFSVLKAKKDYDDDHEMKEARKEFMTASKSVCTAALYKAYARGYYRQQLLPHTAIFDEAHTLMDLLERECLIKLDCSALKIPMELETIEDVLVWFKEVGATNRFSTLYYAYAAVANVRDQCVVEYLPGTGKDAGKVFLTVRPNHRHTAGDYLWSGGVRKVVLLSATIHPIDLEALPFGRRKIALLQARHPIPPERRPVFISGDIDMSFGEDVRGVRQLADRVRLLADKHSRTKGMVHLPYRQALMLKEHLQGDRFIYHRRGLDRTRALDEFLQAPPESGKVLIGSALHEGLDLKGEDYTWQVLGKIPLEFIGSESAKLNASTNRERYSWEAMKKFIQACGRVSRSPDDYGETHVTDKSVKMLLGADAFRPAERKQVPTWLKDAIRWEKR